MTCPCCGGRAAIEAYLVDEAARETVAAALRLPAPLGDLVLRYLGLFRPPTRALSWDRARRLLVELQAAIAAGEVERHGRAWAAPQALWVAGLEKALEARAAGKLALPLKSHGWLFEVVAKMADKQEASAERAREERAGQGVRRGAPVAVGEVVGAKPAPQDRARPETVAAGIEAMRKRLG